MNADKLFAAYFRKYDVHVGEAAIGDPHFLAVQNVMRAIRRKFRAGQRILRIGAGLWLGKAIGADPFAGRELGKIFFLLLLGSKVNDGQCADARVGAVGYGKSAVNGKFFRQHGGSDFIQARAAVLLGNSAAQ